VKFSVILADPPWSFSVWSKSLQSGNGRLPDAHYPTQSVEMLCNLPVQEVTAKDCVLLLWVTCPTLPEALQVIKAWGFTFKTVAFTWIKTNKDGSSRMGMGYWTRANAELCLLATRGKPKRIAKDVRQVIQSKLRRHSEKPLSQYERIERLLSGPYLEIFGRPGLFHREGWTVIGNEATGRDIREDLCLLAREAEA
jgi:N6-adenosine-specific RNA methylase IME4